MKVALVTGAGRGIGRTIVRELALRGMTVAVNDMQRETADPPRANLRTKASTPCRFRPTSPGRTKSRRCSNGWRPNSGRWLLVNNAGVYHAAPTAELSEEAWDQDFAVDVKGTFLCAQAAIRRMMPRRSGRIVNLGSIAGVIVRTNQIGYCSAKAAVVHFSRCLAVEMAPYGITVNCLCPGMTRTEMLLQSAQARGVDVAEYEELIPAGHMAQPEDHASLIAYLASKDAGHITGQVINIDGGQSLNMPLTLRRS